jgi:hypothetical protein
VETRKIGEEIKTLQLLGCGYCKTLSINLSNKFLPILTLLNRRDWLPTNPQQWTKCIGAAATKPIKL